MNERKSLYRQLCAQQSIPLLSTAMWMDTVSIGKDWDVLMIPSQPKGIEQVRAALPYHIFSRWGQKAIIMPQLTMLNSIYLREGEDSSVLQELAQALDQRCRALHIRYCYLKGDWSEAFRQELQQLGFQIEEWQTHQLTPCADREQIVARYSDNKRRQYQHATSLHVVGLSEERFYRFHQECLQERGERISYPFELLHALFAPLLEHGQAALWGAEDAQGHILAAVGLVWDKTHCYYLLPCYWRPESKSGAMAWLTTEAIYFAGTKGLVFDFEGGNEGGIARSYREFGGIPTTYYSAEKYCSCLLKWFIAHKSDSRGSTETGDGLRYH